MFFLFYAFGCKYPGTKSKYKELKSKAGMARGPVLRRQKQIFRSKHELNSYTGWPKKVSHYD